MQKILYVATVQSHIAQFHKPVIRMLQEHGCKVDVVARDNLALKNNLTLTEPDCIYNVPFYRSPFDLRNIKAYKQLKKIINENDYDVIHCNTPVGGVLARLASKKARKKGTKVLYEAHGFHFFKGGSKKNWLLYYPIEKLFSKYTDVLVTINKMDYALAKEKFATKKIEYIPGAGVNLQQFLNVQTTGDIREELGLDSTAKIVLSVGELNKNKNQQAIIRAIAKIADKEVHYVIAGNGPKEEELRKLAKKLQVEERVHFLGYRRDLPYIYQSADVFALPSYREGLGLASIEAMYFGLPIITSNRHGINDYSITGVTGYKYAPKDYDGFAEGLTTLLNDAELREKMGDYNKGFAQEFSVEKSVSRMQEIYGELLGWIKQ